MGKPKRIELIILSAGLALALYYLFVFWPLSKESRRLSNQLSSEWYRLATMALQSEALEGSGRDAVAETLNRAMAANENMEKLGASILKRIALEPEVQSKMQEPFQLVQFQNARQSRIEDLVQFARANEVTLGPAVVSGFPEYTADQRQPALLWAQLSILDHVLYAAIAAQIQDIQAVQLPSIQSQASPAGAQGLLYEFPIRVEFRAPMSNAAEFLVSLPLLPEELKALGLSELRPSKPAIFIDQILVRKNSALDPDEVHVDLRVSGFTIRE